jgi:hydroxymethylpyrimidine/phosphomethylpyrimidine kinase
LEKTWKENDLVEVLRKIYLITPNIDEAVIFGKVDSAIDASKKMSEFCAVFLKGGHSEGDQSTDILFYKNQEIAFAQNRLEGYSKHGSGCVMSSAIAAYLAKGEELQIACAKAKKYIHSYLQSSNSLLGYHVLTEE